MPPNAAIWRRTAPLDQRLKLQQMAQTLEQLAQEFDADNDRDGLVIEFTLPKDRPKER
jgi:hypothetical protein